MVDNTNPALDLLTDLLRSVANADASAAIVKKATLPEIILKRGVDWAASVGMVETDLADDVTMCSYFDDERVFYVFSYDATPAEQIVGTLCISHVFSTLGPKEGAAVFIAASYSVSN